MGSHCTLNLLNLSDNATKHGTDLLQSESSHKGLLVGSLVPGKGGEQTFPHISWKSWQPGGWIVNARSLPVSNRCYEHKFLIVWRTHWVVWIIPPKCTGHWDRGFEVSWPTISQSPADILPDLLRLVSELISIEKCLHRSKDTACNLWPSGLHSVIALPVSQQRVCTSQSHDMYSLCNAVLFHDRVQNVWEWDIKNHLNGLTKWVRTPSPIFEWRIDDIEYMAQHRKKGVGPMWVIVALLCNVGNCSGKELHVDVLLVRIGSTFLDDHLCYFQFGYLINEPWVNSHWPMKETKLALLLAHGLPMGMSVFSPIFTS